jgi:Ca2+-transporting ATPase
MGAKFSKKKDKNKEKQPRVPVPGDLDFKYGVDELTEIIKAKSIEVLNNDLGGVQGIVDIVLSDARSGLRPETNDWDQRRKEYGRNVYPQRPLTPFWKILLGALNDFILIVLIFLAFLSIALGVAFPDTPDDRAYGWIDGFAILVAVTIVAMVGSVNDWQKEKKFRDLFQESKKFDIKVIRQGQSMDIPIDNVLVGDLVELIEGDQIPADGLCVESMDIKVDESNMNGEPDHILKSPHKDPFLLSGCVVAEGAGKMIVTAVGINSEWGQTLAALVEGSDDSQTPLEEKLDGVAKTIGKIGFAFGILTFVVLLAGFLIRKIINVQNGSDSWSAHDAVFIVNFVVVGITIVVVAVPEGLPLAVTIALAFSVRKMMKDKNLVRHLAACETMGGATNICSDKTGTLTLNQMRVVKGCFNGQMYNEEKALGLVSQGYPEHIRKDFIDAVVLNSRANLLVHEDVTKEYNVQGNKTEGALLVLLAKHFKLPMDDIRATRERYTLENRITKMYVFSSTVKRMTTIIDEKRDGSYQVYTKGASEIVLDLCSTYISQTGEASPMTDEKREELGQAIVNMASQGLRTICIAYKNYVPPNREQWDAENAAEVDSAKFSNGTLNVDEEGSKPVIFKEEEDDKNDPLWWTKRIPQDRIEQDLTCLAIVGIKDPLRPEVKGAIEICRKAGIFVRMVTGDNILTAKFIARDCGILTDEGTAIEGKDFRVLSDEEIDKILPTLQVMARSSPTDKLKLVQALQRNNEVVAVTGDGTNDGPALKEADVGLSMGLSGTQIAKEASDIVILDDNFNSIVKSVLWGRCIFENIQKFLQFQLTINFVALILTVVSSLTSYALPAAPDANGVMINTYQPPLGVVQLLWVNLIMDTFAALALATEEPIPEMLYRPPNNKKTPLISLKMWIAIFYQAGYQLLVLCLIYYGGLYVGLSGDDLQNRTVVFNTFVFCNIFNEWNARKVNWEYDVFSNIKGGYLIVIISLITAAGQALIVHVGGKFTQTTFIDWYHWIISVSIGFFCIPLHYFMKLIGRAIIGLHHKRIANKKGKATPLKHVAIENDLLSVVDQEATAHHSDPVEPM